jgi:hypothetical protein
MAQGFYDLIGSMFSAPDQWVSDGSYRTTSPSLPANVPTPMSVRGLNAVGDFIPGYGDVKAIGEAGQALSQGELLAAGLLGTGAAIGLVPGAGDALARPVIAAGRRVADAVPSEAIYAGRSLAEGDFGGVFDAFTPGRPAQSLSAGAIGHNGGPRLSPDDSLPTLTDVLRVRAQEMELPKGMRVQPESGGAGILDRDYFTPAPSGVMEDLSGRYPRNPDPTARLPKGDRARGLVERRSEIASALADRILATGQMDENTRYFYHTDGPIYRAAKAAGLTNDEAGAYLRDLGNYVAATSPRTKVEENLRSATLAMAKDAQGIPVRQIVGPGTVDPKTGIPGISEKGYPMMTGKGGIHGILLDDVIERGAMNVDTNPKPSNFGPNIAGNRSGVTVDTHAIRGTLITLNEMEPGSVPEGFILPKFRDQYAEDPSILTPDMIDDTLGSQMVDGKKMQTEYSVFADIWHDAADKLGVSPAEAQSMGWFGFGDETNLGSARKTPVEIFDDRLSVTAKALGVTPEEAARAVFTRRIPLLGTAVGATGLLGAMDRDQLQQDTRNYLAGGA